MTILPIAGIPAARPVEAASFARVRAIALEEMIAIAGTAPWMDMDQGRGLARRFVAAGLEVPASALAHAIVSFDDELAGRTLRDACARRLARWGVDPTIEGVPLSRAAPADSPAPRDGPLIVIANHPGLYDALALFAAVAREDLRALAARRSLLEALPNLRRRLIAIDPGAAGAFALKRAVHHLRAGGALLHFPAGAIEPDPRVAPRGSPLLRPWKPGLAALLGSAAQARPDVRVTTVAVAGVISPRARALARLLGRGEGLTDALVPLIQLTFPAFFGDAAVTLRFGPVRAIEGADATVDRLRADLGSLVDAAAAN